MKLDRKQVVRPYGFQTEIIPTATASLVDTGHALIVMATGTGKTLTTAFSLKSVLTRHDRVLFLCHNEDILDHAMREFRKVFGEDMDQGLFTGRNQFAKRSAQFLFSTLQTMQNHKTRFRKDAFTALVVDESHHGQAPTFKETITYFTPRYLLGMTATPNRLDRKDISEIFGPVTVNLPLHEAIARKYVTPISYRLMTIGSIASGALEALLFEVRDQGRRVTLAQLNRTLFIEQLDDEVIKAIEAESGSKIIFCENTMHAERMAERLTSAARYDSKQTNEENTTAYESFVAGTIKHLVTVNKFNEGVDMPDAQCVVFLRGTQSPTIFLQQLGRGLRKAPGKERVVVLDFVGNVERIAMIEQLMKDIEDHDDGDDDEDDNDDDSDDDDGGGGGEKRTPVILSGDGYDFRISSEAKDILALLRQAQTDFYSYEEASRRAQELGIKTSREYQRYSQKDPRLPSHPAGLYKTRGWISWPMFLGTSVYSYEEASKRVQEWGIKTSTEYFLCYPKDSRLPSAPYKAYEMHGWVSWYVFLGTSPRA